MMKCNGLKFAGWLGVMLAVAVVLTGLTESAYCQTDTCVLLLQKTPLQGGHITPSVGIHQFETDTEVILTAVPKPGYHFVYWLGDVSDPTANSTIAYIDGPKIIIAVFERAEYEFLTMIEMVKSTYGGGFFANPVSITKGGGGGGGGRRRNGNGGNGGNGNGGNGNGNGKESDDFPVPEEGDDFPVPVPEPATAVLLVLGSLTVFTRRRVRK